MGSADARGADVAHGFKPLTLGGYAVRWLPQTPSERIVLRYAIADHAFEQPDAINCRAMQAPDRLLSGSGLTAEHLRQALSAALQRWRDVADITFLEAEPGTRADIVIGEQSAPEGFAYTNVALGDVAQGRVRPIVGATVCLNPMKRWKIGFDGNLAVYDLVHTLTHEIGHVIGLDHPSSKGHLMSFRYTEALTGLSEGDRRGAVAMYGPSRIQSLLVAIPESGTAPPEVRSAIGRGIATPSP